MLLEDSDNGSGRKIIAILEKNPKKDESKYDEDDIAHMRKVVAYCKRCVFLTVACARPRILRSWRASLQAFGPGGEGEAGHQQQVLQVFEELMSHPPPGNVEMAKLIVFARDMTPRRLDGNQAATSAASRMARSKMLDA
jgi:hypothetical protein